jgi:hypothetical protein
MKMPTLVLLVIFSLKLSGQTLSGEYKGKYLEESINFVSENEIEFKIFRPDGLGGQFMCGSGIYHKHGQKLKVTDIKHDQSLESKYKILNDSIIPSGFDIKGQIVDEQGSPVVGVYFVFKVGKTVTGFSADSSGHFSYRFDKMPNSTIEFMLLGYSKGFLNYMDKHSIYCSVVMKESNYTFLDGHTLFLKTNLNSENKIFTIEKLKIK